MLCPLPREMKQKRRSALCAFHRRHTAGPPCTGLFHVGTLRRREALVGLDPTAPWLILGELMFNTTAENYPSPSQQQVLRGITQFSVLPAAGECCSLCGTCPAPHITFCVMPTPLATAAEEKNFTGTGRSKLPSALLLFSSVSSTSSVQ